MHSIFFSIIKRIKSSISFNGKIQLVFSHRLYDVRSLLKFISLASWQCCTQSVYIFCAFCFFSKLLLAVMAWCCVNFGFTRSAKERKDFYAGTSYKWRRMLFFSHVTRTHTMMWGGPKPFKKVMVLLQFQQKCINVFIVFIVNSSSLDYYYWRSWLINNLLFNVHKWKQEATKSKICWYLMRPMHSLGSQNAVECGPNQRTTEQFQELLIFNCHRAYIQFGFDWFSVAFIIHQIELITHAFDYSSQFAAICFNLQLFIINFHTWLWIVFRNCFDIVCIERNQSSQQKNWRKKRRKLLRITSQ